MSSTYQMSSGDQGPGYSFKGSDNYSECHLTVSQTVTKEHQDMMPPQAVQPADGGDNQGGMSVRTFLRTIIRVLGVQANRLIVYSPLCSSKHSHIYDSAIRHLSILRQ